MIYEWQKTDQTFALSFLETQFCTLIAYVLLPGTFRYVLLPGTQRNNDLDRLYVSRFTVYLSVGLSV